MGAAPVIVGGVVVVGGTVAVIGGAVVAAGGGVVAGGAVVAAGGGVVAGGAVVTGGVVVAGGVVIVVGGAVVAAGGGVVVGGAVVAGGVVAVAGGTVAVVAGGGVAVVGGTVAVVGGAVVAAGGVAAGGRVVVGDETYSRGLPDEGPVPVTGALMYCNSAPCLRRRSDVALTRLCVSPSASSDKRTIFFGLAPGREEAKFSAKPSAPERFDSGPRGYMRSSRPIIASTSPIPSTRRDISSLGLPENEIRWKVSPIRRNSRKKGPIK